MVLPLMALFIAPGSLGQLMWQDAVQFAEKSAAPFDARLFPELGFDRAIGFGACATLPRAAGVDGAGAIEETVSVFLREAVGAPELLIAFGVLAP